MVFPAVGPLFPGHVMVVSREHFPSLATMGINGLTQYRHLTDLLRTKYPTMTSDLLEIEHGGVESQTVGPCISHTHVNLIPFGRRFAAVLDGKVPLLSRSCNMLDVLSVTGPYFFVRCGDDVAIYQDSVGQSQLVRRLIGEACDRTDWNWVIFPQDAWINETLAMWKGCE